jgi:membrane protein YqaA with SNARE-associated domain
MPPRPDLSEGNTHRHWPWIAFVWGFAEATFFFVVPDVFITRIALRDSWRRALLACVFSLCGALIGGTLLWFAAAEHDAATTLLRWFTHLPGINRDVVAGTGQALYKHGPKALLAGGLLGQPYKLFAVHAGVQQIPLGGFLFFSAVARFARFALTATFASLVGFGLKRWPTPRLLWLHALVWLCFYTVYFLTVR